MTFGVIVVILFIAILLLLPTQTKQAIREATGMKIKLSEATDSLARAIGMFETGWRGPLDEFPTGSAEAWSGRARKNLNPGNLLFHQSKRTIGKDSQGYAIFRTASDGWQALVIDVSWKLRGLSATKLGPDSTLRQFITVYAPPPMNPTTEYVKFVSQRTGLPPDTPFKEVIDYA